MNCPLCGNAVLTTAVREEQYEYRSRSITIAVAGDYCAACGEGIHTADQTEAYLATVKQFRTEVDAEPLPPVEIKRIRKRLRLTQRQAGELLGGGIRAYSQYERGVTRPGKAADTLLRLLDRHPELLEELPLRDAA